MPAAPPYYTEDGANANFVKQGGNTLGATLSIRTLDGQNIEFKVNDVLAFIIENGSLNVLFEGKIGINDPGPANSLSIGGAAAAIKLVDSNSNARLKIGNGTALPAPGTICGSTTFQALDSDANETNYVTVSGIVRLNTNGAELGLYKIAIIGPGDVFILDEFGDLTLPVGKLIQGNGGAVTQATNINTGVTLNTDSGEITTVSATIAAGADESFVVTNSAVGANDHVGLHTKSYGGTADGIPICSVQSVASGSFVVNIHNRGAVALDAVVVMTFLITGGAVS